MTFNCPDCSSCGMAGRILDTVDEHGTDHTKLFCINCNNTWPREGFIEYHTGTGTANPDYKTPTDAKEVAEAMLQLGPNTMKVPCSFPDCPSFKTIDPTERQEMPVHWLCEVHQYQPFVRCGQERCIEIFFPTSEQLQGDCTWYCPEHSDYKQPTVPLSHGADLEAAMAAGPHYEPKPVLHTPVKKKKYRRDCDYSSICTKFIMLPEGTTRKSWFCVEHDTKPREAAIQTADQNAYKKQVDKAFTDLVMLMAFNKWNEESVRDILTAISSNSYAMGFQDGKDSNG